MQQQSDHAGNVVLIRGACLWILMALLLAWSLVALYNQVGFVMNLFPGKSSRILQAHIDFLLMSALILGFYAARVSLPWHVRWAMVTGAFTNSSLFLMFAIFPVVDPTSKSYIPHGVFYNLSQIYLYSSLLLTSYGFGRAATLILLASVKGDDNEKNCKRCGRELR